MRLTWSVPRSRDRHARRASRTRLGGRGPPGGAPAAPRRSTTSGASTTGSASGEPMGLALRRLRLTRPYQALLGARRRWPKAIGGRGLAGPTRPAAVALHLLGAEVEHGLVGIVRGASQLDSIGVVVTAQGIWVRVVIFELARIRAGATPAAALVDKGAPPLFTLVHRAFYGCGNVARRGGRIRILERLARGFGFPEAPAFELAEEQGHSLVDDLAEITVGQLVTQEALGAAELVAKLCAGRELALVVARGLIRRLEHGVGGAK